ncbi:putative protein phosphatase 2C family [Helianthus annuus]|nr:putative protein phosphatase 2C family [Helianthus annuus]
MNYTEQQLTAAAVSERLRSALAGTESGAPPKLLSPIQRCWDANTDNRPLFDDIVTELDLISENNKSFTLEENDVVESTDDSTKMMSGVEVGEVTTDCGGGGGDGGDVVVAVMWR